MDIYESDATHVLHQIAVATVAIIDIAIKNPVPDRVKPPFIIFDIRGL